MSRLRSIVRASFLLALALLAGCSCCEPQPHQTITFLVDDATATRISGGTPGSSYFFDACRQECNVLAGRVDAGAADAALPDVGTAHPTLPASGCVFEPSGASWLLTCSYDAPCPV